MDLAEGWRASLGDDELRLKFHNLDFDDNDWAPVRVPSHWSTNVGFAGTQNLLYRCEFDHPEPTPNRRYWLKARGIAQQGDLWFDGNYLGDTDGYFVPHTFEITDQLNQGSRHVLAVDVNCRDFGDPDARTTLTGALQDPEFTGYTDSNPGGIWRPVEVYETGQVAIRHFRALCVESTPERSRLFLRAVIDNPETAVVHLRTRVAGTDHTHVQSLAPGENRVEWTVDVADAPQWWPRALGGQPLHDLVVEAMVDEEVHDRRQRLIGFRTVEMRDSTLYVNGHRLYVKGIAMGPTHPLLGTVTPAEIEGDVRAVSEAGLDLIRLTAHVGRPELYDAADRVGLLIWQDLPVRGKMARSVRTQARRQAREMVDLLGHHPSVAIWCGHDEPFPRRERYAPLTRQVPTWNRTVLDRTVSRIFELTDGSRPVVAHTAVPPNPARPEQSTSHVWFGWERGRAADLADAVRRFPRIGQFVSAFGAASVNPARTAVPEWPGIDWDWLAENCGVDAATLRAFIPPGNVADGERWSELTLSAQAEVIRTTIEILRRLKYRPSGGFIHHLLADPTAAGGFGILDSERRPKPAWQALVDACRPVIIVSDPLPLVVHPGDHIDSTIHVVSDLRSDLESASVRATVRGPGFEFEQTWVGPVGADDCARIGALSWRVTSLEGPMLVDLELTAPNVAVTNRYRTTITN